MIIFVIIYSKSVQQFQLTVKIMLMPQFLSKLASETPVTAATFMLPLNCNGQCLAASAGEILNRVMLMLFPFPRRNGLFAELIT